MKIHVWILTAMIAMGLGVAGCGMVGGGKTIVKYENMPIEAQAPADGMYALYSTGDYNPRVRVQVKAGDTLGFRKNPTGQLFGVAGQNEYPLTADNTYYWKRES
jgi:hypothetical protein